MLNLGGLGSSVFRVYKRQEVVDQEKRSRVFQLRDVARRIAPMRDGPWRSFEMMQTAGDMVLHVHDVGGYREMNRCVCLIGRR